VVLAAIILVVRYYTAVAEQRLPGSASGAKTKATIEPHPSKGKKLLESGVARSELTGDTRGAEISLAPASFLASISLVDESGAWKGGKRPEIMIRDDLGNVDVLACDSDGRWEGMLPPKRHSIASIHDEVTAYKVHADQASVTTIEPAAPERVIRVRIRDTWKLRVLDGQTGLPLLRMAILYGIREPRESGGVHVPGSHSAEIPSTDARTQLGESENGEIMVRDSSTAFRNYWIVCEGYASKRFIRRTRDSDIEVGLYPSGSIVLETEERWGFELYRKAPATCELIASDVAVVGKVRSFSKVPAGDYLGIFTSAESGSVGATFRKFVVTPGETTAVRVGMSQIPRGTLSLVVFADEVIRPKLSEYAVVPDGVEHCSTQLSLWCLDGIRDSSDNWKEITPGRAWSREYANAVAGDYILEAQPMGRRFEFSVNADSHTTVEADLGAPNSLTVSLPAWPVTEQPINAIVLAEESGAVINHTVQQPEFELAVPNEPLSILARGPNGYMRYKKTGSDLIREGLVVMDEGCEPCTVLLRFWADDCELPLSTQIQYEMIAAGHGGQELGKSVWPTASHWITVSDPGEYNFRVIAEGRPSLQVNANVVRGRQNKNIVLDLARK
jgi:hypothetical protein